MSNFADGYAGDWAPHKPTCKCQECTADRRTAALESQVAELRRERDALKEEATAAYDRRRSLTSILRDWQRFHKDVAEIVGGSTAEETLAALRSSREAEIRAARVEELKWVVEQAEIQEDYDDFYSRLTQRIAALEGERHD